jgi:hypothetical protein
MFILGYIVWRKIFELMLAIGGWLLAIGCWRLAVGGWLLAIGGWLLAVGFLFFGCC